MRHSGNEAEGSGPAHPPTEIADPAPVRVFGSGVPAVPAVPAAHATRPPRPARPRRRRPLVSSAVTAGLLLVAAAVFYVRFHHGPLTVTGARIVAQARAGCTVDVDARIATNGAAGTVSYRWVFRPGPSPVRPLRQSVTAGQHALDVTVEVAGSGHGSTAQTVTLQVLSPSRRSASTTVALTC